MTDIVIIPDDIILTGILQTGYRETQLIFCYCISINSINESCEEFHSIFAMGKIFDHENQQL